MSNDLYTFVDSDCLLVTLEFYYGKAFIHVTFRKRFSGMRAFTGCFQDVKSVLRSIGYTAISALVADGNIALRSFSERFGLKPVRSYAGYTLMEDSWAA